MTQKQSMLVSAKDFRLSSENACICGRKNKDKYMEYQDSYREQYGVFPELDKKHHPFTTLWNEPYEAYCFLKKRGFWGAWFYHDWHGSFNRKLKNIYHEYKKEWSFFQTINLTNRTFLSDIVNLAPQEHIVDDLGYRKDADGNYYEGTWKNGRLVYGFMYIAAQNVTLIGCFHAGAITECHGVGYGFPFDQKRNDNVVQLAIGIFKVTPHSAEIYRSTALHVNTMIRNNEIDAIDAYIGNFEDGYANGKFYNKEVSDEIRIGWGKYKDGELKSSSNGFHILLHLFLGAYMTMYFMIKFTYCLPIYLIYRFIQKKNWR